MSRWRSQRWVTKVFGVDDSLDTALTHIAALYGLYISQRQNVVNYFLAGIGLLAVAYATAVDKGRAPVAVAVCALGLLASVAAYLQDQRLRTPMRLAEDALCEAQHLLAGRVQLPSVEIQRAIDRARSAGPSRGMPARALYGAVAALFVLGAVYAVTAR